MLINSMTALKQKFKEAIEENYKYIAVIIKEEGLLAPTLVIDNKNNFQDRLEYYTDSYDDNLNHRISSTYIIDIIYSNSLTDFEFNYDINDMELQGERLMGDNDCEDKDCVQCEFKCR